MARESTNTLDLVANDLAQWIDDMANQLAEAMSAGGNAPFAAVLTEQQKLDYWTAQMFGSDGQPNLAGRTAAMQKLGPEGFAMVFKAVIKAHPDLAVPSPPPGAQIPAATDLVPSPVATGPKLPGLPASLGIPRTSGGQALGEDALSSVTPGAGSGPLG